MEYAYRADAARSEGKMSFFCDNAQCREEVTMPLDQRKTIFALVPHAKASIRSVSAKSSVWGVVSLVLLLVSLHVGTNYVTNFLSRRRSYKNPVESK